MSLGLFEKYSSTSSPKSKYPPLTVKTNVDEVRKVILKYLEDNHYENVVDDREYLDLYCERNGFDVTFEFTQNGLKTILNISVYGDNKFGRTRGQLKRIYSDLLNLLDCEVE